MRQTGCRSTNFIAHFRSPKLKLTQKPLKKHTNLPLNKFQNIFKDEYGPLSPESETYFGVPIGLRGAEWDPSPFCDRSPTTDVCCLRRVNDARASLSMT